MPPRFAYWTIIAGGLPTAFRATDREELLPTFQRLKEKQPDAEMKWFARGKLWESPEAAHEGARQNAAGRGSAFSRSGPRDRPAGGARARAPRDDERRHDEAPARAPEGDGERRGADRDNRGRDWRPGGVHRDPRQKVHKDAKKARNIEHRQQKFARKNRDTAAPAHGEASGRDAQKPRTFTTPRDNNWVPKSGWTSKPPHAKPAYAKPYGGARPGGKPGDTTRKPFDRRPREGDRDEPRRDDRSRDARRDEPRRDDRPRENRRDEPRRDDRFRDTRRDEPRRDDRPRESRRDEPRRDDRFRDTRRDEPRRDDRPRESRRDEPRREAPGRDAQKPRTFSRPRDNNWVPKSGWTAKPPHAKPAYAKPYGGARPGDKARKPFDRRPRDGDRDTPTRAGYDTRRDDRPRESRRDEPRRDDRFRETRRDEPRRDDRPRDERGQDTRSTPPRPDWRGRPTGGAPSGGARPMKPAFKEARPPARYKASGSSFGGARKPKPPFGKGGPGGPGRGRSNKPKPPR